MPSLIPLIPGQPEQRISIALDRDVYVLRFRWNTSDDARKGAWYLDAWEADGVTPIAFGLKLVLGALIGKSYNHQLFMGGLFLVERGEQTGEEPRLFDLGGRVALMHFTVADRFLAGMEIPPT